MSARRLLPWATRYEGIERGGTYPEPFDPMRHPHIASVWRALLGRPMDNVVRTDATFFHAATTGYPSRWLRMAGWKRSVLRIALTYAFLLTLFCALTWLSGAHARVLRIALENACAFCAVCAPSVITSAIRSYGLRIPVRVRIECDQEEGGTERAWELRTVVQGRRAWNREVVRPLARALAGTLSRSYHPAHAHEWVSVPRDYMKETTTGVVISLPATFTGADERAMKRVVRTAQSKLALTELAAHWSMGGAQPMLTLKPLPAPPPGLTFTDVRTQLEAAPPFSPFLGVVAGGEGLNMLMHDDGPHLALSAATGAGKTTTLKVLIMQYLHWGWGVIVLDWKVSAANAWLCDLPGVKYLTDIEDIHDMGVRIGEEVDIRKVSGMTGRANVVVVRNEWNATAELLADWWADYRAHLEPEERRVTSAKSPATRGYSRVSFAGREFGITDVVEAQRLSARVFNGNADVREQYRNKLMARYSQSTVKMLVGDLKPFPRASKTMGRWTVVAGEEVHIVQIPYVTDQEAREFALAGQGNPTSPLTGTYAPDDVPTLGQRNDMHRTQGDQLRPDATRRHQPGEVIEGEEVKAIDARKLADMVDALKPLGVTRQILRNAARADEKGDPAFPAAFGGNPNRGYTYDFEQVKEWARRRHASVTAEGEK